MYLFNEDIGKHADLVSNKIADMCSPGTYIWGGVWSKSDINFYHICSGVIVVIIKLYKVIVYLLKSA